MRWWEIRRIPWNGLLFAIGLTSLLAKEWLMGKVIPVGEDAVEPFALAVGVIVYAIMANLCYTLGWIVELGIRNADSGHQRMRAKRAAPGRRLVLKPLDQLAFLVRSCILAAP